MTQESTNSRKMFKKGLFIILAVLVLQIPVLLINGLIIDRGDDRREEFDLLHGTRLSLSRDVVTHTIGLDHQDHHSASKVLRRTAQGHTDGQGGGREDSDERGDIDTQRLDHEQQQQQGQGYGNRTTNEGTQGRIDLTALEGAIEQFHHPTDQPTADQEDNQGNQQLQTDPDQFAHQVGEELPRIEVHELVVSLLEIGLLDTIGQDHRLARCGLHEKLPHRNSVLKNYCDKCNQKSDMLLNFVERKKQKS